MNHHLHRAFAQAELARGIGLRHGRRFAHEPRLECLELVGLAGGGELLLQHFQRTRHDGQRPFAVEERFGGGGGNIGDLEGTGIVVGGGGVERFRRHAAAALEALLVLALVGEKMFQRAEKIGAETSALRVRLVEAAVAEDAREEFLRQLARRVLIASLALEEAEDGLVVAFAQFTERDAGLRRFAACAKDERPACRGEGRG